MYRRPDWVRHAVIALMVFALYQWWQDRQIIAQIKKNAEDSATRITRQSEQELKLATIIESLQRRQELDRNSVGEAIDNLKWLRSWVDAAQREKGRK